MLKDLDPVARKAVAALLFGSFEDARPLLKVIVDRKLASLRREGGPAEDIETGEKVLAWLTTGVEPGHRVTMH